MTQTATSASQWTSLPLLRWATSSQVATPRLQQQWIRTDGAVAWRDVPTVTGIRED